METTLHLLLNFIRHEVLSVPMPPVEPMDEATARKLYTLAKAHDLSHLCEDTTAMPAEVAAKFQKQTMLAVYRYERIHYEYERICDALETARIPFLPLKGSLIRAYYPAAWMRTSCDVDVLVEEGELERAVATLLPLGFTEQERTYHDVSLTSESGVHLELHFHIKENVESIDRLLARVWEYAVPAEGKTYAHVQTNEYLLFHTVAHMSYHFLHGGCGIRPLIDLYLLRAKMPYDEQTVRGMMETCGISTFYDRAVALCEVWLEGKEHTDLTRRMERFILTGGVYGSTENLISVRQSAHQNRAVYLWRRVFPTYESLAAIHPKLKKHPCLLPFFYVRRWFRAVFCGKLGRSGKELKQVQMGDRAKIDAVSLLLSDLGLK